MMTEQTAVLFQTEHTRLVAWVDEDGALQLEQQSRGAGTGFSRDSDMSESFSAEQTRQLYELLRAHYEGAAE